MSKTPAIAVELVCKPKSQWCHLTTLAGDGDDLWVNGQFSFFKLAGATLRELRTGSVSEMNHDLLVAGGGLFAAYEGVFRSTDGGASFEPIALPVKKLVIHSLALDARGTLWAGGETYEGKGIVLFGKPDGSALKAAKGAVGRVTVVAPSRHGALVGDRDGHVWIAKDGVVKRTSLEANARIRIVYETASGVILALAEREEVTGGQTLVRSTDGGKSFQEVTCKTLAKEVVGVFREIPDGPLIAGAWGSILVSSDDGVSFAKVRHPGKDERFTTSTLHKGTLLLGGPLQSIVSVTVGKPIKLPPKPPKAPPKVRSSSGYVGSGTFRVALESLVGPLKKRAKSKVPDWLDAELDRLPPAIAAEVYALFTLYAEYKVPELCGLREGGYCTIPAQFDMDADAVREEEWFRKSKDIDFVMHALEIFNHQGNPFILVAKDGVYHFYDDPYGYALVAKDLASFLQVLLALEAAKRGKGSVAEAKKLLEKNFRARGKDKYENYVTRTLEALPPERSTAKAAKSASPKSEGAKASKSAKASRYECTRGGANKFWEIARTGASLTTRFGKIGAAGQSSTKSFASLDEARAAHDALVREKLRKGYVAR